MVVVSACVASFSACYLSVPVAFLDAFHVFADFDDLSSALEMLL